PSSSAKIATKSETSTFALLAACWFGALRALIGWFSTRVTTSAWNHSSSCVMRDVWLKVQPNGAPGAIRPSAVGGTGEPISAISAICDELVRYGSVDET